MIEADTVDAIKIRHVVLVRCVVAVPSHHVERRGIDACRPQPALELAQGLKVAIHVLKRCDGIQKITWICQPVGADWSQVGQAEGKSVVLANIPTGWTVKQLHAYFQAARNDAELA